MTLAEQIWVKKIIRTVAKKNKITAREARVSMQEALDAAWAEAWTSGNIHGQVRWQRLFGVKKPSVEEFIIKCAEQTKREENNMSSSLDVSCDWG